MNEEHILFLKDIKRSQDIFSDADFFFSIQYALQTGNFLHKTNRLNIDTLKIADDKSLL